mmetsp:Transcript_86871/g.202227  ORF Transcript_86871/g.202227 Transcript_86871/m.202227 type:complete len:231 (-) Transcript_86871:49-741(-)
MVIHSYAFAVRPEHAVHWLTMGVMLAASTAANVGSGPDWHTTDSLPLWRREWEVRLVAQAQAQLEKRLLAVAASVNTTQLRVHRAAKAANKTLATLMGLQREILEANNTAAKNYQGSSSVTVALGGVNASLAGEVALIEAVFPQVNELNAALAGVQPNETLSVLMKDNLAAFKAIQPTLDELEERLDRLEGRMGWGSLSNIIDRAISKELTDVLEDVARGWRSVPDPWVD